MTFRRSPEESIVQEFEREFGHEILKSNRLRVTILMGVLGSALMVVPILSVFSFNTFKPHFTVGSRASCFRFS